MASAKAYSEYTYFVVLICIKPLMVTKRTNMLTKTTPKAFTRLMYIVSLGAVITITIIKTIRQVYERLN